MSTRIDEFVPDRYSTAFGTESQLPQSHRSWLKAGIRKIVLAACGVTERLSRDMGLLFTFDDGPHPEVTPAVLDLLAKYKVCALFFVVGNRIPRAPQILERILEEGHAIGNHTFQHPLDYVPSLRSYYKDVAECQSVLQETTGYSPRFFRPPLGSLTLGSLLAPRLLGLRTLLWSIDTGDWKLRRADDAVVAGNRLVATAAPGDIVLLHDDNPCVLTVLEIALQKLSERQVEFANAARIDLRCNGE